MLSEQQIAQYHEDGYVIPDFRWPEEHDESQTVDLHKRLGITDHSVRTLDLMHGIDASGGQRFPGAAVGCLVARVHGWPS